MKVQADKSKYFTEGYNKMFRFVGYYYQIKLAKMSKPSNILEIGIGNKIVSSSLKNAGYNVTTLDHNSELEPDYVGDIRELPFESNSFDTILCFEVMEHLPFEDFEKILLELHRVSRKFVIISIPYSCAFVELILDARIPLMEFTKKISIRIPNLFVPSKDEKNKEHYWEMGRRGYPKRKIKKILKKYFKIHRSFHPELNSYHYLFYMEKIE